MIVDSIKNAYADMTKRGWTTLFFAWDIHRTIIYPDYDNSSTNFYPYAKEALALINECPEVVNILYTCSHPEEIDRYQEFFKNNGLTFKYVNENPEVPNTALGCFTKKFYFNVIVDDKGSFNPEKEWKIIYKYFKNKKRGDKWWMKFWKHFRKKSS